MGEIALKSPKPLSQSIVFYISKNWQDVYTKLDDNIVNLGRFEKFGTWFDQFF